MRSLEQTGKGGHASSPGYFGTFGGRFVPEVIIPVLEELEGVYREASTDEKFQERLTTLFKDYIGRPTALTHVARLSDHLGGAQIYLKREDLAHTGAHKINNAVGQCLLAAHMGKRRIVAETGAGQHGVATAAASALLGLQCHVYMGSVDMERQAPNVFRMRLFGAEVIPVESGTKTLKDAINEAMRDWITNVGDTFYVLGSALGPHPYPTMVRDFQSIIGREARQQIQTLCGRLPDMCIACVGGGSNAIGLFHAFIPDSGVMLIGVEAGGKGIQGGEHAARFSDAQRGRPGVLHGTRTFVLQNEDGQVLPTHSVSAGLDYPAVGPEHAELRASGRAEYTFATDSEALAALKLLAEKEGILCALESAHALAEAIKSAQRMTRDKIILVNLSGRGDKDLGIIMKELGN